jgi:ubiquinone/menaquinone biosynthesis C-methylase UbiE
MKKQETHVCPWWLGYFLINPIRKYGQHPVKILSPYVKPGMEVIDYGSAMGYFSIPMAKMAGSTGKVHCIDIQQRMLDKLQKRANNANVQHSIETKLLGANDTLAEFRNRIDFALLFAVVHEVPDKKNLFTELNTALKAGGKILFAEPSGHITHAGFEAEVAIAESAGFNRSETLSIFRSHAVVLQKS